jgi:hypothetical protein
VSTVCVPGRLRSIFQIHTVLFRVPRVSEPIETKSSKRLSCRRTSRRTTESKIVRSLLVRASCLVLPPASSTKSIFLYPHHDVASQMTRSSLSTPIWNQNLPTLAHQIRSILLDMLVVRLSTEVKHNAIQKSLHAQTTHMTHDTRLTHDETPFYRFFSASQRWLAYDTLLDGLLGVGWSK